MEDEEYKERIKAKYIIAVSLMLFFVLNDLVFDFLFNFDSSDYISFACTLIAAIIVFYSNYSIKKGKITTEFENAESFIKSNFDNWQVAFSILDIICGIISILSGIAFIAAIFKVVKIGYVPLKVVVVTNKGKSIVKAASKASLIWTSGRLLAKNEESREKDSMFKKIWKGLKTAGLWIYANKKSLAGTLGAIVAGVSSAMIAQADLIAQMPELFVFGYDIMPYLVGLVIFGLTELGVTGRGFEKILEFFTKQKEIKAEKEANKVVKAEEKKADKAKKEQAAENKKAQKLLKKLEAEEKELQAKQAAEKAKQQAEAEKKAEEQRLLQKALALKAQKEAEEKQKVDSGV